MSESKHPRDILTDRIVKVQEKILNSWGVDLFNHYFSPRYSEERRRSLMLATGIVLLKKRGVIFSWSVDPANFDKNFRALLERLDMAGILRTFRRISEYLFSNDEEDRDFLQVI